MAADLSVPRASARLSRACALYEDVARLKYVSGTREEALRRLGIERVGDLLSHIPFRYLDFTRAYTIESAPLGEVCTIVGTVDKVSNRPTSKPGMTLTEVFLVDESGVLKVAFFKQPWLAREFARGDRLALIGKMEFAYGFKQMASPHFENLDGGGARAGIQPVHRVTDGISQAWMRRIASVALEQVGVFCDPVPGAGVSTVALESGSRDIAYGAVRDALAQGRQAYIICPMVSPQDAPEQLDDVPGLDIDESGRARQAVTLHDVETEAIDIRRLIPGARVEVLHGKMAPKAKDDVIDRFGKGEIDILVSTTVVEVGVDVPNATVMLIENGERFGLATLHQLRGRVGRGSNPGTCYVLTEVRPKRGSKSPAWERLQALAKTDDGFELAEMDLRLRHEGEILGLRQHGGVALRFVDLDADTDLIEAAHEDAEELLRYSRDLTACATMPMRHEVIARYGDVFKEVSGG